jgi:hypothetical protein
MHRTLLAVCAGTLLSLTTLLSVTVMASEPEWGPSRVKDQTVNNPPPGGRDTQ